MKWRTYAEDSVLPMHSIHTFHLWRSCHSAVRMSHAPGSGLAVLGPQLSVCIKSHHLQCNLLVDPTKTQSYRPITWLMPATDAQESCTRNLCKSSGTRNLHVCCSIWHSTSFLYAIEHSSITAQTLSSTWHKPCNVRDVLMQETMMNFASSGTSFLSVSCRQKTNKLNLGTTKNDSR